mmetsp:Transcript_20709/g.57530  ORF Transcript_20709/g.57530 Transcript_20709/m.57530 type:complete len:334 (-) Transcript_20709:642-1643(-)
MRGTPSPPGTALDLFLQSIGRCEQRKRHVRTIRSGRVRSGPGSLHARPLQFPRLHHDLQPHFETKLHRLGTPGQRAAHWLSGRPVRSHGDSTLAAGALLGDHEIFLFGADAPCRGPGRIHWGLPDVVGATGTGPHLCHHILLCDHLGDDLGSIRPDQDGGNAGGIVVCPQRPAAIRGNGPALVQVPADAPAGIRRRPAVAVPGKRDQVPLCRPGRSLRYHPSRAAEVFHLDRVLCRRHDLSGNLGRGCGLAALRDPAGHFGGDCRSGDFGRVLHHLQLSAGFADPSGRAHVPPATHPGPLPNAAGTDTGVEEHPAAPAATVQDRILLLARFRV